MKYQFAIVCMVLTITHFYGYSQSLSVRYGMPLPMISMEAEETGRIGIKAPVLSFTDLSGKTWQPADWTGKVLYLYCCTTAMVEEPAVWNRMHYLAEKYTHFNMLFLVMVADSSRVAMQQLSKLSLPYVVAVNQQRWLHQLGAGGLTASVVINTKGRISYWQDTAAAGKLAEEADVLERLLAK